MEKKRMAVVADPYLASLYRLVGATVYEAQNAEEAARALEEIVGRGDIGVVLVASELYSQVEDVVERIRAKRPDLVITRLPTVRERGQPLDVQRELLRALGMG